MRLSWRCLCCLDDWDCGEGFWEKGLKFCLCCLPSWWLDTMRKYRNRVFIRMAEERSREKNCERLRLAGESYSVFMWDPLAVSDIRKKEVESLSLRLIEVGRDLWRSLSPSSCSKQGAYHSQIRLLRPCPVGFWLHTVSLGTCSSA